MSGFAQHDRLENLIIICCALTRLLTAMAVQAVNDMSHISHHTDLSKSDTLMTSWCVSSFFRWVVSLPFHYYRPFPLVHLLSIPFVIGVRCSTHATSIWRPSPGMSDFVFLLLYEEELIRPSLKAPICPFSIGWFIQFELNLGAMMSHAFSFL